jgi:hypothetical protein
MSKNSLLLLILTVISVFLTIGLQGGESKTRDRVKLRDVKVLTLYHGRMTTGRRTRPLPQLTCIGGTNRCKYLPPVIQCYNRGSDGVDIQWECKTDMDVNLRFNKIEVTCEGYDYPEDDYVLAGSCALEYSIDSVDGKLHPETEHRFNPPPRQHFTSSQQSTGNNQQRNKPYKDPDFHVVVILGIIAGIMYLIWKNCIEAVTQRRDSTRADPPPPPYPGTTPNAPPPPAGFRGEFFSKTPDPSSQQQYTDFSSSTRNDGSRPGFWSGLGLGSLVGYFFGGRNNRGPTVIPPRQQTGYYPDLGSQFSGDQERPSSWGSSWFGSSSSANASTRRRYRERTPSPTTSSSSGSKIASGFGGTSRR